MNADLSSSIVPFQIIPCHTQTPESDQKIKSENNPIELPLGKEIYLHIRNADPADRSATLNQLNNHGRVLRALNRAILQNDPSIVEDFIEDYPKEFKEGLVKADERGLTPVFWSVIKEKNVLPYLVPIATAYPAEFSSTLDKQDKLGYTYLSLLVQDNARKTVEFLAKNAPVQFKRAVRLANEDGDTPVALTVIARDLKMLRLLFKYAPEECKYAMTMQNNDYETPVILASQQSHILKFMHSIAPQEFEQASLKRDDNGLSVLDVLKEIRPHHYNDISKFYDKESTIKRLNKEIFNRKALSHFFDIAGTTDIIEAVDYSVYTSISLEGWRSPQWFNLIEKELHRFRAAYPHTLEKKDMDQLITACRVEADHQSYSMKDRFKAIKKGFAFVSTGHFKHEVTLFVWDGWFGIGNRGESSHGAVEFFQFNPKKLTYEIFKKIVDLCRGPKENYEKVLYEELVKELGLVKTPLALELEKNNHLLPMQEVGNCSLVSPITTIYAYRVLIEARGMKEPPPDLSYRLLNAVDWYHTWLCFSRISVLERNIRPLENGNPYFKPDHELISQCLKRAHLLNLDDICSQKLKELADIYLNSLDYIKRRDLRCKLNDIRLSERRLYL